MTATMKEALRPIVHELMFELLSDFKADMLEDVKVQTQQTLFNQQEMAKRQNVSVTTFVKWRKAGLQAEPNPTGKLLFDLNKVNEWRKQNAKNKVN